MPVVAEGPYFEELVVGQTFDTAPGITLTPGHAAQHQAIVGDRLALPLDATLCEQTIGASPMAHPALVWDVAIGHSTLVTQHVKANLFYRGLAFKRIPLIGDTLRTRTEVVALRQNTPREGRWPTGLVGLHITTIDQADRPVLNFWRCAMLPLRDATAQTGRHDSMDEIGAALDNHELARVVAGWRLARFAACAAGPRFADLTAGMEWEIGGGDVVSNAPELARLTLNIAQVHHAAAAGGTRLVYGGHTIGVALSQATRALPGIATVLAWLGCDHLGPVREGDTLYSTLSVEHIEPLESEWGLVRLRSRVWADQQRSRAVLDWRFVVVVA